MPERRVVSMDAKKKELVGQFKNAGRTWTCTGNPVRVDCHDFPGDAVGKALPYGIYDMAANTGWATLAPTTTPQRSRWNPCAAGGTRPAGPPTRTPPGC